MPTGNKSRRQELERDIAQAEAKLRRIGKSPARNTMAAAVAAAHLAELQQELRDLPPVPLVKVGTENDDQPPLIIEHPDSYPFKPGERDDYREATADEYERYRAHFNQIYDQENPDG